jgi:hypothetical protein
MRSIANSAIQLLQEPRSKYVESTLLISNLTGRHIQLLHKAVRVAQNYIRAQIRALIPARLQSHGQIGTQPRSGPGRRRVPLFDTIRIGRARIDG